MQYIAIAFILAVGFAMWKILRWTFRLLKNAIQTVIDAITIKRYGRGMKYYEWECAPFFPEDGFPEDSFSEHSIDQNEFSRIAMRTAYRHQRVEDVDVRENDVYITIISQTGYSKSHAKITFDLRGRKIGDYQISRDNYDTTIPEKIAERIRMEIRKQVGLEG